MAAPALCRLLPQLARLGAQEAAQQQWGAGFHSSAPAGRCILEDTLEEETPQRRAVRLRAETLVRAACTSSGAGAEGVRSLLRAPSQRAGLRGRRLPTGCCTAAGSGAFWSSTSWW